MLIVEALDAAFSGCFMSFITDGGYQIQERASGERVLYRFQNRIGAEPEGEDSREVESRARPLGFWR